MKNVVSVIRKNVYKLWSLPSCLLPNLYSDSTVMLSLKQTFYICVTDELLYILYHFVPYFIFKQMP